MTDTKTLIVELSSLIGVSGVESEVAKKSKELLSRFGKVSITPLGSVLCEVMPPKEGRPNLLLDAHIDEIGMIVTFIEESGFIKVAPCGGVDRRVLSASQVSIHTKSGIVIGVVCSTPPHLFEDKEKKNKKVEEIHIDVGLNREEAQRLIAPGDRVTLCSRPIELLNRRIAGKAMDCRAGCAAIILALEQISDSLENLDIGLSVLFSSMEEIGGQGAKTGAWQISPTHAIAVDLSFAYTPDAAREKCAEMDGGPMIGIAPILSDAMSKELEVIAKSEGIPYQFEIMSGKTGTDADSIAAIRAGVRCGLISIPLRYMHTPIETISATDLENTARLIAAYTKALGGGKEAR